MDNLKVIELGHKYFVEKAAQAGDDSISRMKSTNEMRNDFARYLKHYDEQFEITDQDGKGKPLKFPVDFKDTDPLLLEILNDFKERNIPADEVCMFFEGFLDKIKEGWDTKFEKLKGQE